MARIAYSCCGEGRGHSSRTLLIATLLRRLGHEVHVYASHAAYAALSSKLPNVKKIAGLVLEYRNNRVEIGQSIRTNLPTWRSRSSVVSRLKEELRAYRPHLVITDFEPFLPAAAREIGVPFIAVDHQHVIPGLRLKPPLRLWPYYFATLALVRWTHTGETANLVTSFFQPNRPARPHYRYFAPILREEIASARPNTGEHVLVYQTSASFTNLPDLLQGLPIQFRIYAFPREGQIGNCIFKSRNHPDFLEDLISSAWVLTNGGYTLMSEALALGKPVLSLPIEGQFEQWINSYHLQKLGYGEMVDHGELTADRILAFGRAAHTYQARLRQLRFNGNEEILREIVTFL